MLASVLTVVGGALLAAVGLTAGIVCGLAVSWLAWLWGTGATGMAVSVAALLLLLVALFFGCRIAAYGMGSRLGAALPAIGWTVAVIVLTGYTPGGDIVLSNSLVNYLFIFGGVLAVTLGTASVPAAGDLRRFGNGTRPGQTPLAFWR